MSDKGYNTFAILGEPTNSAWNSEQKMISGSFSVNYVNDSGICISFFLVKHRIWDD